VALGVAAAAASTEMPTSLSWPTMPWHASTPSSHGPGPSSGSDSSWPAADPGWSRRHHTGDDDLTPVPGATTTTTATTLPTSTTTGPATTAAGTDTSSDGVVSLSTDPADDGEGDTTTSTTPPDTTGSTTTTTTDQSPSDTAPGRTKPPKPPKGGHGHSASDEGPLR
jgi:hypothetical protein